MNETQALQILDAAAAEAPLGRRGHAGVQQATQVLARALQELAELRRGKELPEEVSP